MLIGGTSIVDKNETAALTGQQAGSMWQREQAGLHVLLRRAAAQ
jgi:hypothetical protein